uniref:MBD domain-containing protein n=1 Tax=Syphacia muris TaxID=451379 RepID=A0A0N5B1B6_9BILA
MCKRNTNEQLSDSERSAIRKWFESKQHDFSKIVEMLDSSSTDEDTKFFEQDVDMPLLEEEQKRICEKKMRDFYLIFHALFYKEMQMVRRCDLKELSEESMVNVSSKYVFDEVKISMVVLKLFFEHESIQSTAKSMGIEEDEVVLLALDHVWKECGQVIDGYNLSLLLSYTGVSKNKILKLGLHFKTVPNLEIHSLPLLELPLTYCTMLTVLYARMNNWPLFHQLLSEQDLCPWTEDNLWAHYKACQMAYKGLPKRKVVEDADCSSESDVQLYQSLGSHFKVLLDAMREISAVLPPTKMLANEDWTSPLRAEVIACSKEEKLKEQFVKDNWNQVQRLNSASISDLEKNEGQEDVSVVDFVMNKSDCTDEYLDARDLHLYHLAPGTKGDGKTYSIQFDDGELESNVEFSRVAVEVNGNLRNWEGMRICALYKRRFETDNESAIYAGTVGMGPYGVSNELLVFFDNGCDEMVLRQNVCLLAEQCYHFKNGKKEFDNRSNWTLAPKSRQLFLKHYLRKFPDWQLVRMKRRANTQRVNVMRGSVAYSAYVLDTDRQFALLRFPLHRKHGFDCVTINCQRHQHFDEWIYRGSDRLDAVRQNIEKEEDILRGRPGIDQTCRMSSIREVSRLQQNFEMAIPLAKSALDDSTTDFNFRDKAVVPDAETSTSFVSREQSTLANSDIKDTYRQKQTARKSGTRPITVGERLAHSTSSTVSRPKGRAKLISLPVPSWEISRHNHAVCSPCCVREQDKDPDNPANHKVFNNYSPFAFPLLTGWSRMTVSFNRSAKLRKSRSSIHTVIAYRSPCGRVFYTLEDIANYLKETKSFLTINLFSFENSLRPRCYYSSPLENRLIDDYADGMEYPVAIPVVNDVDLEHPQKILYDVKRRPFNEETDMSTISTEFCSGCTCIDDCSDAKKCSCRQLTRGENLRLAKSLQTSVSSADYSYGRLSRLELGTLLSGIYECNSNCQCNKQRCNNRVVQRGIRFPIELFKTKYCGWGIRTLVDIPAGTFVCNYVGMILTDNQAEMQGQLVGDTYFANVDFAQNVESEKRNAGVDLEDDDYYSGSEASRSESPEPSASQDETDYESGGDFSDENSNSNSRGEKGPKSRTDCPSKASLNPGIVSTSDYSCEIMIL